MHPVIDRLSAVLQRYRPIYYEQLQPGVSTRELDAFEQDIGFSLPEIMRELYQWRNGQSSTARGVVMINLRWMTLEDIQQERQINNDVFIGDDERPENWWRAAWLPFLENGAGDYLCIDLEGTFTGQKGQLLQYWHIDSDRDIVAPGLERWLESYTEFVEDAAQRCLTNGRDLEKLLWEIDSSVLA